MDLSRFEAVLKDLAQRKAESQANECMTRAVKDRQKTLDNIFIMFPLFHHCYKDELAQAAPAWLDAPNFKGHGAAGVVLDGLIFAPDIERKECVAAPLPVTVTEAPVGLFVGVVDGYDMVIHSQSCPIQMAGAGREEILMSIIKKQQAKRDELLRKVG